MTLVKIERGHERLFTFEVDGRRFALWVGAPDEGIDGHNQPIRRIDIALRADDETMNRLETRVNVI